MRSANDISPDYSERIKRLREKLDLTQVRLAELLGVSLVTVNRWENTWVRPSPEAWRQIVRGEEFGIEGLRPPPGESVHKLAEAQAGYSATPPEMDFSADPELVRLVAEGERLTYGHLFNPAFATEISKIDPLPHQRIAVYKHMLPQSRLRFLLADDAGAGKTIMAGLYIREMLTRRLIRRVLVVPPAGLVGNWERELRNLFSLSFRPVGGAEARAGNPFVGPESDTLIVSMDTLAGEKMFARLQAPEVTPYDLVIFDEAHKLSADRQPDLTLDRTDRYRLVEALAGVYTDNPRWALNWCAQHLLLLTATPHMGNDYPYYCLWRLLEPEALGTYDAFNAYPAENRRRHFIRRTKEEMIRFDRSRIYPMRVSNTLSYDLGAGETSEQRLYDLTTDYIRVVYNRAKILNRSAARLAMSIFQRRLASSTWALLCSLQRRRMRLDELILDIQSGKITPEELSARESKQKVRDILDETTGDEEEPDGGREQNQVAEDQALGGVVARTLTELQNERDQVNGLAGLAERVFDQGDEAKFEKLCEIITDPAYRNEKMLIFTEYRDTLDYLVRRLQGIGFAGQIASIHGGMSTKPDPVTGLSERDEQVEIFSKPVAEGGARFLVATDAAGEGINLQFCWLMVNYDIPWNPARLEQRMGRIHRYKQTHDPVVIINLVAGKTREGRVLKTLLDKLERIRRELGSDKVFDVVGRLFEGLSLKTYMEQTLADGNADGAVREVEGTLTQEQVAAMKAREEMLFGAGGEVARDLADQQARMKQEELRRLLPGYVRRFMEQAAPRLDLALDGDLERMFRLRARQPFALDPFWTVLDDYPAEARQQFTFYRPTGGAAPAVFLHPGEPFFDRVRALVNSRFADEALRGGVFIDPYAGEPYFFHLALVRVVRQADGAFHGLDRPEALEQRLIGLKQTLGGKIEEAPVESLLILRGAQGGAGQAGVSPEQALEAQDRAREFARAQIAGRLAETRRQAVLETLGERQAFISRGYDSQDGELAIRRAKLREKAASGDAKAKGDLTKIKDRQRALAMRKVEALAVLRREPELIAPGDVEFVAHAVVLPSTNPEDRQAHDADVEQIAVRVARAYDEAQGAWVKDVSTPRLAVDAGLGEHPGFDLLSETSGQTERYIEVKGRAGVGEVEPTDNEWAQACNQRGRYWLYVVYHCASPQSQLVRVCDPFGKLLTKPGGVRISASEIYAAAESE